MPKHRQVKVSYKRLSAFIDVKIAPLMLEIWKAGIETMCSCQAMSDMDDMVWIEFPYVEEAVKFLNIAATDFDPAPDSLYNRMFQWWAPEAWGASAEGEWFYSTNASDASMNRGKSPDKDKRVCEPMVFFGIAVYFPQSDIPTLVDILQRHNKANRRRGGKIEAPRREPRQRRKTSASER